MIPACQPLTGSLRRGSILPGGAPEYENAYKDRQRRVVRVRSVVSSRLLRILNIHIAGWACEHTMGDLTLGATSLVESWASSTLCGMFV